MENKYSIRLKNLLEELNIKQNELAQKSQVTEATISNYISGKQLPKLGVVERIADTLNVSVDYLLGKSDIRNYSDIKRLNVQDFAVNNSNYDNNKYDISKLDVGVNSFGMMKFYESMKRIQEFQNADLSEKDATDIANLLDAIVPFIDKKADKTDEK